MAVKLVKRLLAGYPNLNAHDPQGYISALVQTMEEFPKWAGERTVLKVDIENAQFPPTDKLLRKWLDDMIRPYRFAAEWDVRSKQQIAERIEDKSEPVFRGTKGDGGAGTIYSNYDLAFEKHGRPTGVFEKD